jgi:Transposase and inactivated derivatives, IS5 family
VVLWHEGPYWRGCGLWLGAYRAGHIANVNDVVEANSLLHGKEVDGYGDAGYQGADKRPDMPTPEPERKFQWHIAMKRSQRKALDHQHPISALQEQLEQVKSKIRAKVEHPFRVIKRQFGHVKVRYRGLRKNTQQLHTLFALANLWMARGRLLKTANPSLVWVHKKQDARETRAS